MSYDIIQQILLDPSQWGDSIYLAEATVRTIKRQIFETWGLEVYIEFREDGINGYSTITCKSYDGTFGTVYSKLKNFNHDCHYIQYLNNKESWGSDIAKVLVSDKKDILIWGKDFKNLIENLKDYFRGNETIERMINDGVKDVPMIISEINNEFGLSLQLYHAKRNGMSAFSLFNLDEWMFDFAKYGSLPCRISTQCSVSGMLYEKIPAKYNIAGEVYLPKGINNEFLQIVDFSDFDFSKYTDHKIIFYGSSVNIRDAWTKYGQNAYNQPLIIFSGLYNVKEFIYNGPKLCGLKDMGGMFSKLSSLRTIDLSKIDSSICRNMSGIFTDCYNIVSLDIRPLNFCECENIEGMFNSCYSLTTIICEAISAPKCKSISNMFRCCKSIKSIDFEINTPKCENMSNLFDSCKKLKSINVSHLNTSQCKDMSYMFSWCANLESLDLSIMDVANCQIMHGMFSACRNLKHILLPGNALSVTDISNMFEYCETLESIDLSSFHTPVCENMSELFSQCKKLKTVNLSSFDTSSCKNMSLMFSCCESLEHIDLSTLDISTCQNFSYMFIYCKNLRTVELPRHSSLHPIDLSNMFYSCGSLQSVNMSNLRVKRAESLFNGCKNLRNVDLSSIDLSKCESMSEMFENCKSLESIDLSNIEMSNCKDFAYMFNECKKLKSIDFSHCRINNDDSLDCTAMFAGCKLLQEINLSNCNLIAAQCMFDAHCMFEKCNSLQTIIMKNCSSEMIDGIKKQLEVDGIHNVKIVV